MRNHRTNHKTRSHIVTSSKGKLTDVAFVVDVESVPWSPTINPVLYLTKDVDFPYPNHPPTPPGHSSLYCTGAPVCFLGVLAYALTLEYRECTWHRNCMKCLLCGLLYIPGPAFCHHWLYLYGVSPHWMSIESKSVLYTFWYAKHLRTVCTIFIVPCNCSVKQHGSHNSNLNPLTCINSKHGQRRQWCSQNTR